MRRLLLVLSLFSFIAAARAADAPNRITDTISFADVAALGELTSAESESLKERFVARLAEAGGRDEVENFLSNEHLADTALSAVVEYDYQRDEGGKRGKPGLTDAQFKYITGLAAKLPSEKCGDLKARLSKYDLTSPGKKDVLSIGERLDVLRGLGLSSEPLDASYYLPTCDQLEKLRADKKAPNNRGGKKQQAYDAAIMKRNIAGGAGGAITIAVLLGVLWQYAQIARLSSKLAQRFGIAPDKLTVDQVAQELARATRAGALDSAEQQVSAQELADLRSAFAWRNRFGAAAGLSAVASVVTALLLHRNAGAAPAA